MPLLNQTQQITACQVMDRYLNALPDQQNETPLQKDMRLDASRHTLITQQLKPLVDSFLAGQCTLADFKMQINSINKRNNHWGFSGIKGQMFFNMLLTASADNAECQAELQSALAMPANPEIAKSRIRTLMAYVRRVGDELIANGGTNYQRPRESSVPLFLSYFWQIHDPEIWPVMYTSSCNIMTELNLWQRSGDLAEDYIIFTNIQFKLKDLFSQKANRPFNLYQVEHVFWFAGHADIWEQHAQPVRPDEREGWVISPTPSITMTRLPESYVPPIVDILPYLASPDDNIRQAAQNSGTTIARAFEKSVNASFTILGYDTQLLGQGTGRMPDGLAKNPDDSYVLIWDAKSRTDSSYALGTDDRAIREYISRQARDLKRRFRKIYFVIVAASFNSEFDDSILELKMETEVNEVCLLEADALVAIVENYLKEPKDFSLGPDGLQRIFAGRENIINRQYVIELFS